MAINLCQFRVQAICDRGSALTWLRELVSTVDQKTVEMWRQAVIDNDPHEDDNTQVCDFVVTNIFQVQHLLKKFASCCPTISVRIVDGVGEAWAVCDERVQGGVKSNDCNPLLEKSLRDITDIAGVALRNLNR